MTLTKTPICDFGKKAIPFELKSTDDKILKLAVSYTHLTLPTILLV